MKRVFTYFVAFFVAFFTVVICVYNTPVREDVAALETEAAKEVAEKLVSETEAVPLRYTPVRINTSIYEDFELPDSEITENPVPEIPEPTEIPEPSEIPTEVPADAPAEVPVLEEDVESEEPEEEEEPEEDGIPVYDTIDEELTLVPDYILDHLYDEGWSIDIADFDISERYGYEMHVVGLTIYGEHQIWITDGYIRRTTIHELGHAIDFECDWASDTYEFYDLYVSEHRNFVDITSVGDGHEYSNAEEYFASVYQNMVLDYYGTYAEVPGTCAYIERVISEYIG